MTPPKKAAAPPPDKPKPVSIYLPAELRAWVETQAANESRSISTFIKMQLTQIMEDSKQ